MSRGQPFVGPIASRDLPPQPKWDPAWCSQWNAFDVPRLWDMLEPEGNEAVREQVRGFVRLSDALEEFYRLLRTRRDQITAAWCAPSATEFLRRLDEFGADLLSNAACARQTAHALDSTATALATAKDQVRQLKTQWDDVTTDWIPEWWNHEAANLNEQARRVMAETDKAVAAARPKITSPDLIEGPRAPEPRKVIEEKTDSAGAGGSVLVSSGSTDGSGIRVPPVPGYDPVVATTGSPALAEVAGAPKPVALAPGQPVSMLPIPPASPYAPFGGAYILPGRGVGRAGYVVPMPPSFGPGRGVGGPRVVLPPTATSTGAAGGVGAAGMVPMPMAGGPSGNVGEHGALYRRPSVAWQVDKGVPPVIKVEQDEFVPDQPSLKQEEEFRDWFSDLAYPWRAEFKSSEGAQVTVRTVPK